MGKMGRMQLCVLGVLTLMFQLSQACNPNDLKALQDFKAGIRYDTSGRLEKWTGRSCCKWEGVTCNNETRRVVEINLPGFISSGEYAPYQSSMTGSLSPSITLVTYLEVLDLGELVNLTGMIPHLIGYRLKNLRKLSLFTNKLTGPLPQSIGKLLKLEELYLQDNSFSGYIPYSIGNLINLERLHLYSNGFTGKIPESITNLTNLVTLCLQDNSLTGQVPARIGDLQALNELDLSNNSLSGIN